MVVREQIRQYLLELHHVLDQLPDAAIAEVTDSLYRARINGRQVFVMGNGGSAATASHFVCDLGKNTRHPGHASFRVMSLTDNMASFSAYANDEGYDNVFARQLAWFVQPDDVVVAISTSGNSQNVINAVELAREAGATTVGFTGFDGGRLGKLVHLEIRVASQTIEQVEDTHLILEHLIVTLLRQRLQATPLAGVTAKTLLAGD